MNGHETAKSTSQATVLIIDDEEMIRDLVHDILETKGYTVMSARDGLEGIEQYSRNAALIDCIILDMTMPRLGGKETYRRLREINRGAKIILSTGRGTDDQAREIIDSGVAGIIQKPYRMEELLRVISTVVGV